MRILSLGDVVGRPGRAALKKHLPDLKRRLGCDAVVVNGENAAAGFGITRSVADEIFAAGADIITGGNHSWDQKEALAFIEGEPRLLRPANFPAGTPGRGITVFATAKGEKLLVVNAMGRLFMDPLDDPFQLMEQVLKSYSLGGTVNAILVDFHAEATSEKMAMGHVLDGRVSAVVGTHTHVPTADAMILGGGSGYITDIGMCGDYDSVIGMDKAVPIQRFVRKVSAERLSVATGEGTLSGVFIETDGKTGLAKRIEPVRLGGKLRQAVPEA